ncbi:YbaB/EbfC family nucleoid-associated protein [Nonomuraea sp. FMUSA5-5]|uniref:YbaB/EbfC family nucleoid-associated protein n=1 Tax=Nonomuraea composti TaxID=2720023 RepID=A0ABX1BDX9_9ACTN|nr:YbaB/EbfC family nucleoid-associated protein [Nonomuraea sp. FMUSA5-5]NJP93318.1 YbaB/EbfC family nucleoid-associated protein [Nonomuraea sp. FMUSA5-5]
MTESEEPMAPPDEADFLDRFAELREVAAAANGLVKVEVDGTSDLVGLTIDPRAMRLPSEELAAAVKEAFGRARAAAQERAMQAVPDALRQETSELTALLKDIEADARGNMNEILVAAGELTARLDRLMRDGLR